MVSLLIRINVMGLRGAMLTAALFRDPVVQERWLEEGLGYSDEFDAIMATLLERRGD